MWWITTTVKTKQQVLNPAMRAVIERRSRQRPNPQPNDLTYVAGTDGTDNYVLGVVGDYKDSIDGRARSGIVPYNDYESLVLPIWLAYGSSHYFATNTAKRTPPLWPLRDEFIAYSGYSLPVTWETDPNSPHLLKALSFDNEGIGFVTEAGGTTPTMSKTIRLSPPYDSGFREAEYKVLASTNLNGMSFPLEFELTVFRVIRYSKTKTTEKRLSYTGRLSSLDINVFARQRFTPDPKNLHPLIGDNRFKSVDPSVSVVYILTNSNWPSKDIVLPIFQKARDKTSRTSAVNRSASPSVFPYVLLVTVCAPPLVWLALRKKRRTME